VPNVKNRESTSRHAFLVAAGILISRIVGLVRQRVFNGYFGLTDTADAFASALRIPNFLQNLFGEGVLSASFIPVYARLLAEGDDEEADRVAGAVGAILALSMSVLVLLGVAVTPYLMWAIAPGYEGPKRELTILLVRILFPGAGLLVCSAWCLGILNSHRKFFLSYTAPVVWNVAMIGTMWAFRHSALNDLAVKLAWGTLLGCGLQFGVQVPVVLRLVRKLRLVPETKSAHVREVLRNFVPVAVSRGVVQISAYVDQALASMVGEGAMAAMTTAQSIYMLPVSLFGMAVSAAELPAMSSAVGTETEIADRLRRRLNAGLRQIAFFIVPSAMAFFALGDGSQRRSTSTANSPTRILYTCGGLWRARPSACWRRRSAAFTRPLTMHCAIRGRRCATPRCGSRSPSAWGTCARCRFPGGWASIRIGARPGSRRRRAWRVGWSSHCCGVR
jgi:putative peptidoglycan lipid II flippase